MDDTKNYIQWCKDNNLKYDKMDNLLYWMDNIR